MVCLVYHIQNQALIILFLKVGVNLPTFSSEYIPNEYAYYTNKELEIIMEY